MTPERAAYHRLMLLAGLREEFDQELDHALETEDPISVPVLDLAFCMSDLNRTISVLNEYILNFRIDDQMVYDMVMSTLRRYYSEKRFTAVQMVDIMYSIAQNHDHGFDDPWDQLRYPSYEYELVESGVVSEEVFNIAFEAAFLRGERIDVWALEKERKQTKKKSILDFFRKHN